jgi:uncharacterized membrane protein YfcA
MHAADTVATTAAVAWWIWPLALFFASFLLGIVAVIAGIGGGVLFVPIVGGFFPFHLDFVRGAGVLLALAAALAAAPRLLRDGLASLRLALPLSLAGSVFSILGALASFSVPTRGLETALGVLVLFIVVLMWRTPTSAGAMRSAGDALGVALGMRGAFVDPADGKRSEWAAKRTTAGIVAFAAIGFVGGLFGLGAGWANVPALNLLMNIPLKLAAGTSGLAISLVNAPAAWVYFQQGAMLPIIAAPSLIGVMLGARVGVHLFRVLPAPQVRLFVIALLLFAGLRSLLKGVGLWT